jgi:hypothetical protein
MQPKGETARLHLSVRAYCIPTPAAEQLQDRGGEQAADRCPVDANGNGVDSHRTSPNGNTASGMQEEE